MRLYTRTRLVLSCIVPCYLIVGFFVSSFLAMWKSEIEEDLRIRAALMADQLSLLLNHSRTEELAGRLRERANSHAWLKQVSILDAYGRVITSDGSPLGQEGILGYDVARRRQILQTTQALFFPETGDLFRPCAIGTRNLIIRVGVDPGLIRRRIWWASRWFLPGWLITGLMALLISLYLSRVTLERLVSTLANQVNRVADGKTAERLPVNEPAVEPLVDGLRRLFRSIEADRGRMGHLERNISETRHRATYGQQESERVLYEKEQALGLYREESRLLWERCGCGILRLDPELRIEGANAAARQWLSLGPSPDPTDLPKGLCRIAESANASAGPVPSYGTFVARHPFFGHERRVDATCIPLGPRVPPHGKPILVFLEEHAPKKPATSDSPLLEGFLRLLKGTSISIGQELHTIEKMRRGTERSQKTRQAILRLARLVRDVETLISSQRLDDLLQGGQDASSTADQLPPAAIQGGRYLGVSVDVEIDPAFAEQRTPPEKITIPIAPQLRDIALREAFAVVGDLNSSTSLRFSVSRRGDTLECIVSPRDTEGESGLFAQTLSDYLQRAPQMRKSADLILLRIGLLQRILEQANGSLELSPDKCGLLVAVPFAAEGGWGGEATVPQNLARAFLS